MNNVTNLSENFFVGCVDNSSYEASLDIGKYYRTLEGPSAMHLGLVRIVDESGEDYLYPCEMFRKVEIAVEVGRFLTAA